MKKSAHISGILFLCMYGMVLLHDLLPHVHTDAIGHPPGEVALHIPHHHHAPDDQNHGHDHSEDAQSDEWGLLGLLTNFIGGFDHLPDEDGPVEWYLGATTNPQVETSKLVQFAAAPLAEVPEVPLPNLCAQLPVRPPPVLHFITPARRQDLQRGPPSYA